MTDAPTGRPSAASTSNGSSTGASTGAGPGSGPGSEPGAGSGRRVRLRTALDCVAPYRPGKPPTPAEGVRQFKISSNENPYPPLPSVLDAIGQAATHLNRYPEPAVHALRERLAADLEVGIDEVAVGAGSSALFSQIVDISVDPGDEVVYAWRSFELYPVRVAEAGGRSVQVPVTADGRHDLPAMAAAVRRATKLVIVCSPNNPTGPSVGAAELEEFLARVPGEVLVLIDQAYIEFDTDDEIDALEIYRRHPNVVVLRTFSKAYGLAGLRVGYAIAHPPVAAAMAKVAHPFAVTDLAQVAAMASLDARAELGVRVKSVIAERDRVVAELASQGWQLPQTQANFVWLPLGPDALAFAALADSAGLAVRPFDGDGVRCTIGEPEANAELVRVCGRFLAGERVDDGATQAGDAGARTPEP